MIRCATETVLVPRFGLSLHDSGRSSLSAARSHLALIFMRFQSECSGWCLLRKRSSSPSSSKHSSASMAAFFLSLLTTCSCKQQDLEINIIGTTTIDLLSVCQGMAGPSPAAGRILAQAAATIRHGTSTLTVVDTLVVVVIPFFVNNSIVSYSSPSIPGRGWPHA